MLFLMWLQYIRLSFKLYHEEWNNFRVIKSHIEISVNHLLYVFNIADGEAH